LLKGALQSRSRFVLLGDVHRRADQFDDITGSIRYRMSDHMNVLGRVWQKKPKVGLKVGPVSNGLFEHTCAMGRVLRVQKPAYLQIRWWLGIRIEVKDPVHLF
jgi:hypothetical protein